MRSRHTIVMAGLVPAIHGSGEPVVEVVPIRIFREDQSHLPGSRPMFHVPFALNGHADIRVTFCVDQPLQAAPLGEPVGDALSMFPHSTSEITGNASIKRAVRSVRYNVDPAAFHRANPRKRRIGSNAFVDGRHEAGHDEAQTHLRYV